MKITSLNNEKVSNWAKLKMKKYRDIEHLFIVESEHLVEEALKKGIVKEIITTDTYSHPDIPVYEVTEDIMKRLSSLVSPSTIMAVCSHIMPDDIEGNILLIERLQDPGNLGTIIRSAVAFGFNTLILSNDTVDVYNDKVIRSSEGMIFNINIIKDDLKKMIPRIKQKGYYVIGTDVKRGHKIKEFKGHKCAFVIGNEGAGMSFDIRELCDSFVYIPMSDKCESLNAAVASSIIMYEVSNE